MPDNLDEFNALDIPYKFFATKHKGAIQDAPNHIWYHDNSKQDDLSDRFSGDPVMTGFGGGGTITTAAIQIASYLGFDPIILIGCDASYSIPSSVKQSGPDKFGDGTRLNLESTEDDDANHFDPRYFGSGKHWHTPNTAEMHVGFEKCYRRLRELGKTLVNATDKGELECMPRADFTRLFRVPNGKAKPKTIGIDLTPPIAGIPTGMRNSLMSTLRGTRLLDHEIQFVLICEPDERLDVYGELLADPRMKLVRSDSNAIDAVTGSLDGIVYPFNTTESRIPLPMDVKRISFVNDLIPLHHPTEERDREAGRLLKHNAAVADAVVCLSEVTRQEIVAELGVDETRCFVASPSLDADLASVPVDPAFEVVSEEDTRRIRKMVGAKYDYVVYPAAYRPHKNHKMLFEAMRYTYSNLHLVLTTGESHSQRPMDEMKEEIERRSMGHRILIAGNLDRRDYLALLRGARAVVFPSLDEGFGIPVVEAQALRVPVLSTRCGALADVAKGSIELDPHDPKGNGRRITDLVGDDELRAEVAEAGWQNSRMYTAEWGASGLVAALDYACSL